MHTVHEFDGHSLIRPETIAAYAKGLEGDSFRISDLDGIMSELDGLHLRFAKGEDPGMLARETVARLHEIKASMSPADWRAAAPSITGHPVSEYFLQDPFTGWSHRKPRGYSGDAGLLDFIYGHQAAQAEIDAASEIGRRIYEFTRNAPACAAVRERREILAGHVDAVAETSEAAEVLAIAAGHLREAELSNSAREGKLARWVALDQDPLSVAEVSSYGIGCIEGVLGSVRDVIARPQQWGQFDLVYSAGLYDYLEDKVAVRMTQKCLQMLKPGGTYLFANFADDMPNDGYMETFMRWELILRSRADMQRIIDESVGDEHVSDIFLGANRTVIYARITRKT